MTDPDDLLAALGAVIRAHRVERRLSQEAVSLATGVHRNYVGGIERGERSPSVATIARIAAALDARVSELFADAERRLG